MLKSLAHSPWVFDSANQEYTLSIGGTVVAKIDANGNLKLKGRILKFT